MRPAPKYPATPRQNGCNALSMTAVGEVRLKALDVTHFPLDGLPATTVLLPACKLAAKRINTGARRLFRKQTILERGMRI
jgi:hypothetical protein